MSAPTGLVLPQMGGAQWGFASTMDPAMTSGVQTLTANRAFLALVRVGRAIPMSQLSVYVGTSSGNLDVGVYVSDGTTLTRLASAGSTAMAGTNTTQTIAVSAITLSPGQNYYFAVALDNGTGTIGRAGTPGASIGSLGLRTISRDASFPLPASIALSGVSGSTVTPLIVGT